MSLEARLAARGSIKTQFLESTRRSRHEGEANSRRFYRECARLLGISNDLQASPAAGGAAGFPAPLFGIVPRLLFD
ncbi:MAG: hypothetical protein JO328_14035 [Hyphomicrobiales bacterium]|nr:hypothetical protein [Hyphomicrobiales bacterium]